MGERNTDQLPLTGTRTGYQTCNPGVRPDQESDQRPSLCVMTPNPLSHTGQGPIHCLTRYFYLPSEKHHRQLSKFQSHQPRAWQQYFTRRNYFVANYEAIILCVCSVLYFVFKYFISASQPHECGDPGAERKKPQSRVVPRSPQGHRGSRAPSTVSHQGPLGRRRGILRLFKVITTWVGNIFSQSVLI